MFCRMVNQGSDFLAGGFKGGGEKGFLCLRESISLLNVIYIEAERSFRRDASPRGMLLLEQSRFLEPAEVIADRSGAERLKAVVLKRLGADGFSRFEVKLDQAKEDRLFTIPFGGPFERKKRF